MTREVYRTLPQSWERDGEDRESVRRYRARFQYSPGDASPLAEWICGPGWTDVRPFLGHHNQPPVSGEIDCPEVDEKAG